MNIIITENHLSSCQQTANIIIDIIINKKNAILGLATGSTAEQVYSELVNLYNKKKISFAEVSSINLDEYLGLSPDNNQSYRYFMNKFLFNHININKKNTFIPIGDQDPQSSLKEFQKILAKTPRDFQLLGVGANGHIAFNEPSTILHSNAHIVNIAESTIKANSRYFKDKADVPKKAFTQGMGDILKAKKIVLLATGENKAEAIKELLLNDKINTEIPCTFLKLHNDVTIFIDQELATLIKYK